MNKYIDFNYDSLFYPAYGYVISECEPAGGGQTWHHTRLVGYGQGWFSGMISYEKKEGGGKSNSQNIMKKFAIFVKFEFVYIFLFKKI